MFKKNYDHLPKDTYFGLYKESTRGNPNYFLTYGNGKSAARIQDHLRPNGAHRWHNYMKTPKYATTFITSHMNIYSIVSYCGVWSPTNYSALSLFPPLGYTPFVPN